MSRATATERACDLLRAQITELGELRNASPRDARFKQWRQNTLTVIQRLWPTQSLKSERFRRIPFSSPSSKMSAKIVREFFERGCAEASGYLQSLVMEIEAKGLPEAAAMEPDAPDGVEPVENAFPIVELPSEGTAAPVAPSSFMPVEREFEADELVAAEPAPAAPASPTSWLPSHMPFDQDATTAEPGSAGQAMAPPSLDAGAAHPIESPPPSDAPPPAHVPEPKATARPEAPSSGASAAPAESGRGSAGTSPRKRSGKRPLKELLGFSDPPPVAAAPPVAPVRLRADAPAVPREPAVAQPIAQAPVRADAPAVPREPAAPPESERREAPSQSPADATIEFLRSSPVLKAHAKPLPTATQQPERIELSPPATSLAALAAEVANLGVPEGQRAAARAALLDLARQLDDRSLTWESLRLSVDFVMDHPQIARRVLPLLIPFLDVAA